MNYNYIDLKKIFKNTKTPIWMMRQAGRYLPEYKKVRASAGSFLDLCYNPELVKTVTLQPIERFDLSASIIFSDILVVPDALGVEVKFTKNVGPTLNKIQSVKDLKTNNFESHLAPVYEGIIKTRENLDSDIPLIGFVGAPWTIATYMVEGMGSKYFNETKNFAYNNPEGFSEIIDTVTDHLIIHLKNQIKAGVNIVMIFDSWSGVLNKENFYKWTIDPIRKITLAIKSEYPEIPIIAFPKDAGFLYKDFILESPVDIIALDSNISRKWIMENSPKNQIFQGNLDPIFLLSNNKAKLEKEILKILDDFSGRDFIFNLGHGILPNTPIENVEFLIKTIREYEK